MKNKQKTKICKIERDFFFQNIKNFFFLFHFILISEHKTAKNQNK